jgi:hypothetical protein
MQVLIAVLGIAVAALVAVGVFSSIVGDAVGLYQAAWWAPAVMLIVPAAIFVYWLRGGSY